MLDLGWALDAVGSPLFHAGAINVLAVMTEIHPRDRLVLRYLCTLDEFQRPGFIIKFNGEDGTWRRPRCSQHLILLMHVQSRRLV